MLLRLIKLFILACASSELREASGRILLASPASDAIFLGVSRLFAPDPDGGASLGSLAATIDDTTGGFKPHLSTFLYSHNDTAGLYSVTRTHCVTLSTASSTPLRIANATWVSPPDHYRAGSQTVLAFSIASSQFSYGRDQAVSTNADGSFQLSLDPAHTHSDVVSAPAVNGSSEAVVSYRPVGAACGPARDGPQQHPVVFLTEGFRPGNFSLTPFSFTNASCFKWWLTIQSAGGMDELPVHGNVTLSLISDSVSPHSQLTNTVLSAVRFSAQVGRTVVLKNASQVAAGSILSIRSQTAAPYSQNNATISLRIALRPGSANHTADCDAAIPDDILLPIDMRSEVKRAPSSPSSDCTRSRPAQVSHALPHSPAEQPEGARASDAPVQAVIAPKDLTRDLIRALGPLSAIQIVFVTTAVLIVLVCLHAMKRMSASDRCGSRPSQSGEPLQNMPFAAFADARDNPVVIAVGEEAPVPGADPAYPNDDRATELEEEINHLRQFQPYELAFTVRHGQRILLGSGGFGNVYRGIYLHADVAIKEVNCAADDHFQRALRELRHHRALNSPNIVQLIGGCVNHGLDGNDRRVTLVMEYMPGGDLFDKLQSDSRFEYGWYGRGREVALSVLRGLSFMHSRRLAHLDLKSKNILLDAYGRAKICDVGLSKICFPDAQATMAGTRNYASPEQLLRDRVTTASDMYSFGVLLLELCGMAPLRHRADRPVLDVPDQAPETIVNLISRLCHPDPTRRPDTEQTVQVLIAASRAR